MRGAAVVGRDDRRLGAVPSPPSSSDSDAVGPDELAAFAGESLARYEVPIEIRIVDSLPRTASGKVDLAAVAELLGGLSVDLR